MNKDAYYFKHDSNARNDPRLLVIIDKYGLNGYGAWWMIMEMLREDRDNTIPAEGMFLSAMASHMRCKVDWLGNLIDDLVEIELLKKKDGKIFSKTMLANMQHLNDKRRKARDAANTRWSRDVDHDDSNKMQTDSKRNADASSKKEINIPFEVFWDAFDYKAGSKPHTKSLWNNLTDNERSHILDHIPAYQQAKEATGEILEHPRTYLNQRRFQNDPNEILKKNKHGQTSNKQSKAQHLFDNITGLGSPGEQDG